MSRGESAAPRTLPLPRLAWWANFRCAGVPRLLEIGVREHQHQLVLSNDNNVDLEEVITYVENEHKEAINPMDDAQDKFQVIEA